MIRRIIEYFRPPSPTGYCQGQHGIDCGLPTDVCFDPTRDQFPRDWDDRPDLRDVYRYTFRSHR